MFDPEGFNRTAEMAIFWTRQRLQTDSDPGVALRRMEYICSLPRMRVEGDVMFVHGSPRGPTNEYVFPEDTNNAKKMEKLFAIVPRFCFQGHTHVPGIFSNDLKFTSPSETNHRFEFADAAKQLGEMMRLMINVGSVGQPRDGDPRSCYVVLDDAGVSFRRVKYDIEETVTAVEREPELDNMLGYRLREGR